MEIKAVTIDKGEEINFILGHSHFIKTVEDIYETMAAAVPGIRFGVAFSEASGKCLVRADGTDPELIELAKRNILAIAAGHTFAIFLGPGFFPINVLNAIKGIQEVCRIHCATANPVEVLVAETPQGRGVIGVVDGFPPKGIETPGDVEERRGLLRRFGYKR